MRLILHPETLDSLADLLGDGTSEIWAALLTDGSGEQSVVSLPNVSASPNAFTITRSGWGMVERFAAFHKRKIVALLHSHSRGTALSPADSHGHARGHLPWIVVTRSSTGIAYSVYRPGAGVVREIG
jgi:proteasome lid subunit RPN8/RPN11